MDELDPQVVRGAGGPDSLEVPGKRMDPQRGMAFVVIEQP